MGRGVNSPNVVGRYPDVEKDALRVLLKKWTETAGLEMFVGQYRLLKEKHRETQTDFHLPCRMPMFLLVLRNLGQNLLKETTSWMWGKSQTQG